MNTTKSIRVPLIFILLGTLSTIIIIYLTIPKDWEDATTEKEDGQITLSENWSSIIEEKQEQYSSHDLYVLTAAADGYFECKHCSTGKFFLKEKEVYRYGTTGIGQSGRGFNEQWLNDNLLNYVHLMNADLTTVKTEEANLIGNYAILPENLKRPLRNSSNAKTYWYRLVLPPGNNSLD